MLACSSTTHISGYSIFQDLVILQDKRLAIKSGFGSLKLT